MKVSRSILITGIVVAIAILVIVGFNIIRKATEEPEEYDIFAKCLSDKDIKIYGAYWCPHCKSQKEMFGKSWKYINYIECSLPNRAGQKIVCNEAGIKAYPTWEFQDGKRIEGELSLEELSQYSNCSL